MGVSTAGSVTTTKAGGAKRDRLLHSADVQYRISTPFADLSRRARSMLWSPPASTTTTAPTTTIYVTSTGSHASGNCATTSGCFSTLVPITAPANTVGAAVNLPATPNSLVFDRPTSANGLYGDGFWISGDQRVDGGDRRHSPYGRGVQGRHRQSADRFSRREKSHSLRHQIDSE